MITIVGEFSPVRTLEGLERIRDAFDKETETKMRQVVKDIFDTLPKDVAVVTGCTNLGISKYV